MATARFYLAGAVLDGKIYALGGNDGVGWSASVEVYDPATNAWTSSVPMPLGRVEFAAAAVGGKIYAIGGTSDRGPLVEEFWPP
jgi:N-acetylneuraminic acid mutarotase